MSALTLEFSPWCAIGELDQLVGGKDRGIYVVAHLDRVPFGPADPLSREVVYIGETHGQTMSIAGRLKLFARAARNGIERHSGGRRYHGLFGDLQVNTYAAACNVADSDPNRLRDVIFAGESELISMYTKRWESRPVCNASSGQSRRGDVIVAGTIPMDLRKALEALSARDLRLLRSLAERLAPE